MSESTLRRKLKKQGYNLHRTRDCCGCVAYYISDMNNILATHDSTLSLEEVEQWANEE